MKTIKLGKFKMESGIARISDPCYEKDTWCAGTIDNVKKGEWRAMAWINDEKRVSHLIAFHKDHAKDLNKKWVNSKLEVGVDSGQCGIYDETFYKDDKVFANKKEKDRKYGDAICPEDIWYSFNCDVTLAEPNAGVIPFGCVSSSGYGDGSYICKTIGSGKKIVAIQIDYCIATMEPIWRQLVKEAIKT